MDFDDLPADDATLLAQSRQRYADGDLEQRRDAIEAVYDLAREREAQLLSALPLLLTALADEDDQVGDSASWALRYLQPVSIEPLAQALRHAWAKVRERAAQSLGNIGQDAAAAAPVLRTLLDDADEAVTCRAAWALGLIRDTSVPTVARLWRLAVEGATRQRASALHALGNLARALDDPLAWRAHRPLLRAAMDDADADVRWSALYAAEALQLPDEEWAAWLCALLASERSSRVCDAALGRLADLAARIDLSGLLPVLTALLNEPRPLPMRACDVLGAMHPPPLAALPALRAALEKEESAFVAARAMWRIQPDATPLLPVLERLFDSHDEEVCDLICEMGPAAAPLLPRVLAALGSEVWDVQWAAVDAVAAIAPTDAESRRVLLNALAHDSPLVRSGAARALARAGAAHVPALRRLLADADDDRSAWAAFALGLIGEAAAEALGELRRGMRAQPAALALACQIAVARIGSADSLPLLAELVADQDASLPRAAAAEALGMLGPAALPARLALETASRSDDADLADAALLALERIEGDLH